MSGWKIDKGENGLPPSSEVQKAESLHLGSSSDPAE
jgi:hypothetical protein